MSQKLFQLVRKLNLLPGQANIVAEEAQKKGYLAAASLALVYSRINKQKSFKAIGKGVF